MEKNLNKNKSKAMRVLIQKAQRDTFFIGSALVQYQTLNNINQHELAEHLECTPSNLDRLSLCRLPDLGDQSFKTEIHKIAEYCQCSPNFLVKIIRDVQVVEILRKPDGYELDGFLLAARDRKENTNKGNPED